MKGPIYVDLLYDATKMFTNLPIKITRGIIYAQKCSVGSSVTSQAVVNLASNDYFVDIIDNTSGEKFVRFHISGKQIQSGVNKQLQIMTNILVEIRELIYVVRY